MMITYGANFSWFLGIDTFAYLKGDGSNVDIARTNGRGTDGPRCSQHGTVKRLRRPPTHLQLIGCWRSWLSVLWCDRDGIRALSRHQTTQCCIACTSHTAFSLAVLSPADFWQYSLLSVWLYSFVYTLFVVCTYWCILVSGMYMQLSSYRLSKVPLLWWVFYFHLWNSFSLLLWCHGSAGKLGSDRLNDLLGSHKRLNVQCIVSRGLSFPVDCFNLVALLHIEMLVSLKNDLTGNPSLEVTLSTFFFLWP